MLKKAMTAALLVLPLTCLAAGVKEGVIPLDEQSFVAQYGSVARQVAPHVYEISQNGHVRSVAFGLDGLRYRVTEFEALAAAEGKRGSSNPNGFDRFAKELRARLDRAERASAKELKPIPSFCGVDGQIEATYYPTPVGSFATSSAEGAIGLGGPQPEGPIWVIARAWRQIYWGGRLRWQLTDSQEREVNSSETTSAYAAASGGSSCSSIRSFAEFRMDAYPGSECNISVMASGPCF